MEEKGILEGWRWWWALIRKPAGFVFFLGVGFSARPHLLGGALGCHGYRSNSIVQAADSAVSMVRATLCQVLYKKHDFFSISQATLALSPAGADVHPKGSSSTGGVHVAFKSAENVEDQLRHVTQIKRIRVSEFFKDFDPLRSGYITSKAPKFIMQYIFLCQACTLSPDHSRYFFC